MNLWEEWRIIGPIIKGVESGISFLAFLTFEMVILVFLTPINSYFAEKVMADMTGVEAKFEMRQFVISILRAIRIFFVTFMTEMVLLLLIWILSFIINDTVYHIIAFTVSSFFIGFSFFDLGLELDGHGTRKSWRFAKSNKLICLVAGLIFSISIYIPEESGLIVLFLVTISLVPHMLTIAATTVYFKHYASTKPIDLEESDTK